MESAAAIAIAEEKVRQKVACIRDPRASKASRALRAPAAASSGRALGGVPRERVRLLQRGARARRVCFRGWHPGSVQWDVL